MDHQLRSRLSPGPGPRDCYHACMQQVTLRLPDDLAAAFKRRAAERGESANAFATLVLQAAVDPGFAREDAAQIRQRLARAGLLADPVVTGPQTPPDEDAVARARAAAGRGTALAELVSENRR